MNIGLSLSLLRHRKYFMAFIIIFVSCTVLFLITTDFSKEETMAQRVAEFQMRMQYLESMYRIKQEDLSILSHYFAYSNQNGENSNASINISLLDGLSAEARAMIRNASSSAKLPANLKLPSAFNFLPHLLDDPLSLKPGYLQTRNKQGVSIVLGIPTVKREKQSYLVETVDNLIANMDDEEQNDTMIIIFIGESDSEYVLHVANSINNRFSAYIESGFIEIISPAASYYPNMNKLRLTLNDSAERVRWRSKQNLDFVYLMSYAQPKGAFYVQLEDDILTKKGFITVMKKFALDNTGNKEHIEWFVLDFCQLGFIGKMFKSADLPWIISFFQMFFNDKPVDWLLSNLIYTKVCSIEKDGRSCKQDMSKLWIRYKPSLFQHIGTTSSLKGKIQKLKDRQFGKIPTFYPHNNPPAIVKTGIQHYKTFTIQRAYSGESFFWGLMPQPGDLIEIKFKKSTVLKRYLFRSGNYEQPSDRFYNTTVEVLPANLTKNSNLWNTFNTTSDGYLVVGAFNDVGIAEGVIDSSIGILKELRLHVYSDSQNWVILREIYLQQGSTR